MNAQTCLDFSATARESDSNSTYCEQCGCRITQGQCQHGVKPPIETVAEPPPEDPIFGPVIYAYTRKQAIEDGQQVEVTETAREAGIKFRTFLTRTVWDQYVEVPPGVSCQDERGRLWDVVNMCRFGIKLSRDGAQRINFQLRVRMKGGMRKIIIAAVVGPVDMDDPAPAITIMLPDED